MFRCLSPDLAPHEKERFVDELLAKDDEKSLAGNSGVATSTYRKMAVPATPAKANVLPKTNYFSMLAVDFDDGEIGSDTYDDVAQYERSFLVADKQLQSRHNKKSKVRHDGAPMNSNPILGSGTSGVAAPTCEASTCRQTLSPLAPNFLNRRDVLRKSTFKTGKKPLAAFCETRARGANPTRTLPNTVCSGTRKRVRRLAQVADALSSAPNLAKQSRVVNDANAGLLSTSTVAVDENDADQQRTDKRNERPRQYTEFPAETNPFSAKLCRKRTNARGHGDTEEAQKKLIESEDGDGEDGNGSDNKRGEHNRKERVRRAFITKRVQDLWNVLIRNAPNQASQQELTRFTPKRDKVRLIHSIHIVLDVLQQAITSDRGSGYWSALVSDANVHSKSLGDIDTDPVVLRELELLDMVPDGSLRTAAFGHRPTTRSTRKKCCATVLTQNSVGNCNTNVDGSHRCDAVSAVPHKADKRCCLPPNKTSARLPASNNIDMLVQCATRDIHRDLPYNVASHVFPSSNHDKHLSLTTAFAAKQDEFATTRDSRLDVNDSKRLTHTNHCGYDELTNFLGATIREANEEPVLPSAYKIVV